MSTWIRIIRNLQRNKLRIILYGLVFFLIGNLLLAEIAIYKAADHAVVLTSEKLKPLVSYEINLNATRHYSGKDNIDIYEDKNFTIYNAIEDMADDEMVVAINHLVENVGYPQNFSAFKLASDRNTNMSDSVTLIGNTNPNMVEFHDGTNIISEGRFYTDEEIENNVPVTIINKNLAMLNNLKIDDYLTIDLVDKSNERYDYLPIEYRTLNLKIIGIYKTNGKRFTQEDQYLSTALLYPNQIYLPASILAEAKTYIKNDLLNDYAIRFPTVLSFTFRSTVHDAYDNSSMIMLNDIGNINTFCDRYSKYTTKYLSLYQNNTTYETLTQPLRTLSYSAKLFITLGITASVVIISIISMISLKKRKSEILILLTDGISRSKLIYQLSMELLIVVIVAFSLSIISGNFIAKAVGNKIISYQQVTDVEFDFNSDQLASSYFNKIKSNELLANYQIHIDFETYLLLYGFGLLIVSLSTAVPTIFIMMIDPKKTIGIT